MTVAVMAQIGIALRSLMNSNGFSTVKLIGESLDERLTGAIDHVFQDMSIIGTMPGPILSS